MLFSFLRLLVSALVLIAACVFSVLYLPLEKVWIGLLAILLFLTPITSYALGAFGRKCYTEETKSSSPFLYALGMFIGVPQEILGLICLLVGIGWIYSYLGRAENIILPIVAVVFSFFLVVLGLSWIFNAAVARIKGKKPLQSPEE